MLTQSTILTALRTGTVSAIATKYLARKNSQTIGIIGNGAQALPQLHAISLIRDIKRVYAYDIDEKASKSFKKGAEKLLKGLEISIVVDAEIASRESDILVTVTCKEKILLQWYLIIGFEMVHTSMQWVEFFLTK
jgi:ornithine cyclodeaminase/alanine dehydrogenase-like protein (mu-crystallin family)